MVKFVWNGIKVDGKLYRAHYSMGEYTGYPEGTITIYARDYESFPRIQGLRVENDSDIMTDYFEKDRVRVSPNNRFYKDVKEAFMKQEEHNQKRWNKRMSA